MFLPFRSRCQRENLRLDEFQHLKLSLLKHNLSEQIQDGGKLFSSVKGKMARGENNPVYII